MDIYIYKYISIYIYIYSSMAIPYWLFHNWSVCAEWALHTRIAVGLLQECMHSGQLVSTCIGSRYTVGNRQ